MTKDNNTGAKIGLGLAAVAAAAGAYYFYGKDGAKHRKNLKSWMVKAQGEVMEKLENVTTLTENSYYQTVNEVLRKYKKLKSITPKELGALTEELKAHWKVIKPHLSVPGKSKSKPRSRK
jgi:hypothetical protein